MIYQQCKFHEGVKTYIYPFAALLHNAFRKWSLLILNMLRNDKEIHDFYKKSSKHSLYIILWDFLKIFWACLHHHCSNFFGFLALASLYIEKPNGSTFLWRSKSLLTYKSVSILFVFHFCLPTIYIHYIFFISLINAFTFSTINRSCPNAGNKQKNTNSHPTSVCGNISIFRIFCNDLFPFSPCKNFPLWISTSSNVSSSRFVILMATRVCKRKKTKTGTMFSKEETIVLHKFGTVQVWQL